MKLEILGDKLRPLVNADRFGIANDFADALQGQYDIFASVAERGSTAGEKRLNVSTNTNLAAGCELVVNKVHRPGLVDLLRIDAPLPQLRLNPTLGRFIARLQA